MFIANSAQIREADRRMMEDYHFPSIVLMERAGEEAFQIIQKHYSHKKYFIVLVGLGNNGGDGLVVARHLKALGKKVLIVFPVSPEGKLKEDPALQFEIIRKLNIDYIIFDKNNDLLKKWIEKDTVIVDALLGTGIRQKVREPYLSVINFFKNITPDVVALDLPSGLVADSGAILSEPIPAKFTITFQLPKVCHYVTPASLFCGKVYTVDIGIFPNIIESIGIRTYLITNQELRAWYKKREENSYKNLFGHVYICGGSSGKIGAAVLAGKTALRMGAGLTTLIIPSKFTTAIHSLMPELMTLSYGSENLNSLNAGAAEILTEELSENKNPFLLIGPGLGKNPNTIAFFKKILEKARNVPMVLDADALNILAENPELWEFVPEGTIITPHPGEAARLLNLSTAELQERRMEYAVSLATTRNVIVVLKGKGTVIASPKQGVFVSGAGGPSLAKAGMGDVLAGLITSLLAQGYAPLRAAVMGVHLHAKAGDVLQKKYGDEGVLPSDIADFAPILFNNILNENANH